jgi:nicotinamide riboside kinase
MVAGDDTGDLTRPARGLMVGRFDPADAHDAFLHAFAMEACDHLTVRLTGEGGEGPSPADGFDVVFGYGSAPNVPGRVLAARLGARFVPVTPPLRLEAVAAGMPLLPPVPPGRVPRICLFGPESTGKSTLGLALAEHYGTVMAPEYGRLYTETFGQDCGPEDLRRIVIGHLAGTRAASRWAGRLLIEDTDPVLTAIWSDVLTGGRAPWFDWFSDTADLYLLTGIDVPFVADGVRYFPAADARESFHARCRAELERRQLTWAEVTGDPEVRLAKAIQIIDQAFPPAVG